MKDIENRTIPIGREATCQCGEHRWPATRLIVAMTANAFEEDKQKAIRAGMNAHIAKPIEAGRLMETLAHILT